MNGRHYYFWIVAKDEKGKPYLIYGSDRSEDEARQKALEMLSGLDFDIKRYPTKDLATASAYLRGKRLEGSHSLKESTRRIGHDKSLKRHKQKKSAGYPFF